MIIIHGDDEISSRALFLSLKDQSAKSGKQLVILSGSSLNLADIVIASESQSLFGSANSVFIEGFFTRAPGNDKKVVTEYLLARPSADMVLWESQDVSAAVKIFPPAVIKKFVLPKYLFQFVDNLSLAGFNQALAGAAPEQILALLARRLHDLILIKENKGTFPPWQAAKLKSQASRFSLSQLSSLTSQLLSIDYAQKTSSSPYGLTAALQFWLAKNF